MKKGKMGIYKITSNATGKVYIGSSLDLWNRKKRHMSFLKYGKHSNKIIQRIYDKYGEKDLLFEFIEYCEKELIVEREQYYINMFRSFDKKIGMNIRRCAYSALDYIPSENTKKKISQSHSTDESKSKRSEISKRLWENKEYREFHLKERKERYKNLEYIEKRKVSFQSEEYKNKRSEIAKKIWENPESREKLLKERKSRWTEERREKISLKNKERFSKPNAVSEETRNKISLAIKKNWEKRKNKL